MMGKRELAGQGRLWANKAGEPDEV
jgi:hypothetical protein